MGANAATDPYNHESSNGPGGPNPPTYVSMSTPLENAVELSADTSMVAVPGGTTESTIEVWR